jgi:hypothetical protein
MNPPNESIVEISCSPRPTVTGGTEIMMTVAAEIIASNDILIKIWNKDPG